MLRKSHDTQICIIGGGLSGVCAALAAARHGSKVVLIQDRPVLGGNSSSEIRMWVRGAGNKFRESGIIMELDLDNIFYNPHMNAHQWDAVLYNKLRIEPNITTIMNCSVCDASSKNGIIRSVTGWQLTTYTWHTVNADIFIDCSGDGILGDLTEAEYMLGREDKAAFGEKIAHEQPDGKHMGMSCLLQARETDHPVKFVAPSWAEKIDESKLDGKGHDCSRSNCNFWWIEVGGNTKDGIEDTEECREKLLSIVYGVWDHFKNSGEHPEAENYELEWVGFLPGKRESRRYKGAYVLTANDLLEGTPFEDTIAYGGWTMDDHDVDGYYSPGYSSTHYAVKVPYPIAYRCLYSANVPNLMFAGRNISASHMAMSSTRVMATCSLMGQAAGTAANLCAKYNVLPADVYTSHLKELQRNLMNDGSYLPGFVREKDQIMVAVTSNLSGEDFDCLTNGIDRPLDEKSNCIELGEKQTVIYNIGAELPGGYALRIFFDPDYPRDTINPDTFRLFPFSQKSHRRLNFKPLNMPANLAKNYTVKAVLADGSEQIVASETDNHSFLVFADLPAGTKSVELAINETYGAKARLYSCDIITKG